MADEIYGFPQDDVDRIRNVVNRVERSPINWTRQQRRYPLPVQTTSETDGGTTSCGCCDTKDCVSPEESMIKTCDECVSGGTAEYTFTIGFPTVYPELADTTTLTFSGGCTWLSEAINVTAAGWVASTYYYAGDYVKNGANLYFCTNSGTSAASGGPTGTGTSITDGGAIWDYSTDADNGNCQWELTQAGLTSTLSLTLDSGTDVMNLDARPFTYTAEAPWSCRCVSKMLLSSAESLMDSNGVDAVVCLTPVGSTGCCEHCWGVTFSGITGPPSSCLGINGGWVLQYAGNPGETCEWDSGSEVDGAVAVHLSWNQSSTVATLTVSGASFPFIYQVTDLDFCDGGSKTMTLVGGAVCTGVPSTVTLSPTDCGTTTTSTSSTSSTSTTSTSTSTTSTTSTSTSSTTGTSTSSTTGTSTSSTTETSTSSTTGTSTTSTSTSSTTAPPCVTLGCEWTWSAAGSVWNNTANICNVPCAACVTPPGFSGSFNGEVAHTDCEISI